MTDSDFQANFEAMFREYEPNATFHYLRSFRRVRVDFEAHLAASRAKLSMDGTPLGNNVIHCYFLQVNILVDFCGFWSIFVNFGRFLWILVDFYGFLSILVILGDFCGFL